MPYMQPGMPGPMYLTPPTSGMATASMAVGIASFFVFPLIGHILAIIFGYIARNEIRNSGGRVGGSNYATAGIILGFVGIGLSVLIIILAIVLIVTTAAAIQHITFPTPTPNPFESPTATPVL
jgi:uncharacterized membrane protein